MPWMFRWIGLHPLASFGGQLLVAPALYTRPPCCNEMAGAGASGWLASLVGHEMVTGSPACLCCGAAEEDEAHILAWCPATGTQYWQLLVAGAWRAAARVAALEVPLPPVAVLKDMHIMLVGALIPVSAAVSWGLPAMGAPQFLAALHRGLAVAVVGRLRRREELMHQVHALDVPTTEA